MVTAHRMKNPFGYVSKNSVKSLYENHTCTRAKKNTVICSRVFKAYNKQERRTYDKTAFLKKKPSVVSPVVRQSDNYSPSMADIKRAKPKVPERTQNHDKKEVPRSRALRILSTSTGEMTCAFLKKGKGKVLGGTKLEYVSPEMFVAHQTPPKYIDRHVIFTNPRHLAEAHCHITETGGTPLELVDFDRQIPRIEARSRLA